MQIRAIRLHRRPAVNALLFVAAVLVAVVLLHFAVARAPRLVVVADSTRFEPEAALGITDSLATNFRYRTTGSQRSGEAAAWLARRFAGLGLEVSNQKFEMDLRGREVKGFNVVAEGRGRSRDAIVLLAHYDGATTCGQCAAAAASGVGVLLELARALESRPHRRRFVYVALDAGTWGRNGAVAFVRQFEDGESIAAAVSLDHVANGAAAGVAVSGVGQGGGYAPLWLRRAAGDAFAYEGTRVAEAGLLEEFFLRAARQARAGHGPLVANGIPAINIGTVPADPAYSSFLFHTPGDRVETLDTAAFRTLGAGVERLVLSLDRSERAEGPFTYLAVGRDRMVRGVAVFFAALVLFAPLFFAVWEAWSAARADPASRAAVRAEVFRAVGWWVIAGVGCGVQTALVATGVLPGYTGYAATERDPFLYDVRWTPVLAVVAAMALTAWGLARVRRNIGRVGGHPFAGRAAALTMLAVLAVAALAVNPFAAVWLLVLPAWLWPWIGPTRRPLTGAAGTLLALVSAAPVAAMGALLGAHYQLGVRTWWYLFLQAAYGAWAPLTVVMLAVAAMAAWRIVGTTTSRLLPESGD